MNKIGLNMATQSKEMIVDFILHNLNILFKKILFYKFFYYYLLIVEPKYLFINIIDYFFIDYIVFYSFHSRFGCANQYFFCKYYFGSENSTIIFYCAW